VIRFLADKTPALVSDVSWGRIGFSFEVGSYLDPDLPPASLVTSVRGVVLQDGLVVVLENIDGRHYLPGGRVEPGEDYLQTLAREVEEECGLAVEHAERLGFLHFRHLDPKPAGFRYPWPDMFQLVYAVEATGNVRAGDVDGYEFDARLMTPEEAAALEDTEIAGPFLEAAIRRWRKR
jgi:ADP-ribose pyrophosphatase YjhB (NUDIX family)